MTHLSTLVCRKGEAMPVPNDVDWNRPALPWDIEPHGNFWGSSRETAIRLPVPGKSGKSRKASSAQPRASAQPDKRGGVRLAARLPETLYRELRHQALQQKRPMAEIVREALGKLLQQV